MGWRQLRRWRAREYALDAGKLLRDRQYPEAKRALRSALEMAPNDPSVLRLTAEWCAEAGSPDGLIYWDRLFQLVPPTRTDLLKKLDLSLSLQRLDVSRDVLKTLTAQHSQDREVLVRAVQFYALSGQSGDAVQAARAAILDFPSEVQLQFLLGGLLLDDPEPRSQKEAREILFNLALGNSAWREAAVEKLVHKCRLGDGDRLLLIHSIEARQPVSLADRLQVLELRKQMAGKPERIWEQIDDWVAQYPGITNQLTLALWLSVNGATNRSVALVPWPATTTNFLAAQGSLEVLVRAQDWPSVRQLLQQTPVALSAASKEAAAGVMAGAQGNSAAAAGYFAHAIQQAGGDATELFHIAGYAEMARQPAIAADALMRAAELNPAAAVGLCRRALAIVQPIEDLAVAHRLVEKLAEYLPREAAVLLERSWLDVLFNESPERARRTLVPLLNHPALGTEARVILALADVRHGEPAAGLLRLDTGVTNPDRLSPRNRAAYAAVLLANNQRESARRLAATIPAGQLRPLEMELVAAVR